MVEPAAVEGTRAVSPLSPWNRGRPAGVRDAGFKAVQGSSLSISFELPT